jgi:hypothetical protein
LAGNGELRIVLKRREDIEAFREVKEGLSGVGVSNVEVVRRLIECYHKFRRKKEEEGDGMREKEGKRREEAENGIENAVEASGLEELRVRLRRAQGIILRQRLELEKKDEYIRAVEDHMARYVLGRSPRRVWRLWRNRAS